jgi:hypothetical protein
MKLEERNPNIMKDIATMKIEDWQEKYQDELFDRRSELNNLDYDEMESI